MENGRHTIAITGASAGIGEATARLLAARGDRVVLAARRAGALQQVVAEIEADGGRAMACAVDVTRPEDLRALVERAVGEFGRLDALVASAGVATVAAGAAVLAPPNEPLERLEPHPATTTGQVDVTPSVSPRTAGLQLRVAF